MSILSEDKKTTLTVPHLQLIGALQGAGFDVEVETSFPPKWVDCYLPEYHVAVEADGPYHTRQKDMDRDAFLMVRYALPVLHVTAEELSRTPLEIIRSILIELLSKSWGNTLVERRMISWRNGALQQAEGVF